MSGNRKSVFERNPKKTIAAIVLLLGLVLDFGVKSSIHYYKIFSGFAVRSSIYHHDFAKRWDSDKHRWGEHVYRIRTNSLGFKDSDTSEIGLKSDKRRILFIGDSFTEGVGAEFEDTFPGMVREALKGDGIEVLNASRVSYSPVIYWRKVKYLLEEAGLRFDDLVVYVDISDASDEALRYTLDKDGNVAERVPLKPDGNPKETYGRSLWLKLFLKDHSVITHALLKFIYRIALNKKDPEPDEELDSPDGANTELWRGLWTVREDLYEKFGREGTELAGKSMDRLFRLAQKHGIGMWVAVYPWPAQIKYNDRNSRHVAFWREWCGKRNIPFIDHFPDFKVGQTEAERTEALKLYFFPGDVHWNPAGHRRIADRFLSVYKKTRPPQ